MNNLYGLLEEIPAGGSGTNSFHAAFIPGQRHAFGRDPDGFPVLLIHCAEKGERRRGIVQNALEVRFNETCNIASQDGTGEDASMFTSLTCTSKEEATQKYFAFVCEVFLQIMGDKPSNDEIFEIVQNLIEIFRKLGQPSTQELNGLFGELYYLSRTQSPKEALAAWRLREGDKYDFWTEQASVEVKTCSANVREHIFAIEQCNPKTEYGMLVSIQVERIDVGLSLRDLQSRIRKLVEDDSQLLKKLEDNIAQCLGQRLPAALDISFDEGIAKESLRLYDLNKIPAIKLADVPREVAQVRFASNLANVENWAISDLKKIKALADFLPKD